MYKPFVEAFNDALKKLSAIDIEGLPSCEPEKEIAFFDSHDRSVESLNHLRAPQVKPDIVLLQSKRPPSETSNLFWTEIRSTVEIKSRKPPKHVELPETFSKDFGALTEIAPDTPLVGDVQPGFIPEELPANKCKPVLFPRSLLLICLHRSREELGEIVREETTRHRGNCA